ncbi:MAG: Hsp20/alpha crystallin family protein [Planctomycetales bacterium]|nr:Hsp20/alpha crystallin family protein [Planctomycetales bacterium]
MKNTCSKNRVREHLPSSWSEFDSLLGQVFGATRPTVSRGAHAPASLWEDESAYHLELDLPGVAQADVEITLEKGILQIAAERKRSEQERTNLHEERFYGKVARTLALPDLADAEGIEAELKDGVLHVTVAKSPEKQPKRIEVK